MKQHFYVEKDPAPMKVSAPWRVVCAGTEGPFKPHVQGGFKTRMRAQQYCAINNLFVDNWIQSSWSKDTVNV